MMAGVERLLHEQAASARVRAQNCELHRHYSSDSLRRMTLPFIIPAYAEILKNAKMHAILLKIIPMEACHA
jgi:hypothetical protein